MNLRVILTGCVKNRRKEVALASIMLSLFLFARTFKIQIGPGFIDLTGVIVNTAASILSWPYTLLFSLSSIYFASNVFSAIVMFLGSQGVFFLSKIVKDNWKQYTPVFGQMISLPTYGVLLQVSGIMSFKMFMTSYSIVIIYAVISTFFGGVLIWKTLKRLAVFD